MPHYIVKDKKDPKNPQRLVEAQNPAQVFVYLGRDRYDIELANTPAAVAVMSTGVKPEKAKEVAP